jgi:ribose 5-phosphate isomerase A
LKPNPETAETAKKNAAQEAAKYVKDKSIVGLGSGTTAAIAIEIIGERIRCEHLSVLGIPTSTQAFLLAVKNQIPVTTLDEHPNIDVTIDGADQIDPKLNLIKGMGAALTREKIVAASSKLNIITADNIKKVATLGEGNHPVPIEVLPFALQLVKQKLERMQAIPILREGKGKLGPVITDNGNMVLDTTFGIIEDPTSLAIKVKMIPGVIETGLFVDLADIAIFGSSNGTETTERKRRR